MALNVVQLLGTWRLEWAHCIAGDLVTDAAPFGERPQGLIHYLPDNRMAVLIAHSDRQPMSGGRTNATDEHWLRAAQGFVAYAGSFDIDGGRIVHHVEINSYSNDVGVDYPRVARIDGDILDLATPPDLPADQRAIRLRWRRVTA